ncbi:MAG: SRPBCC domain-containing protein [Dehalococcoidia bacterium]
MTTQSEGDVVEMEVRIAARPETIFSFFTDPAKMMRWKGISATLDPQPGGIYRVDMNGRDVAHGEYLEVVPHSRVVFTWGWEGGGSPLPPGSSTVEVTLVPDGDSTIVRLQHRGLSAEQRDAHAEGWNHYLPRLVTAAEGRDPGPDPWAAPAEGGD